MSTAAKEIVGGITRLTAPNPSPMTFRGTNTYVLKAGQTAVVDPGPRNQAHLRDILVQTGGKIDMILITHSHLDHSPLAFELAKATGAPVLGFGSSKAGQSPLMAKLEARGELGGGEGLDLVFEPSRKIADGEVLAFGDDSIQVIHTPGHLSNHVCFQWGAHIFSGDHVMDWATSMVSPPDGDLRDFMASCQKLQGHHADIFLPGHGEPVADPARRLKDLIAHRNQREAQILAALSSRPKTPQALAQEIYTDVNPALLGAAARNVFAHLIALHSEGAAEIDQEMSFFTGFRAAK